MSDSPSPALTKDEAFLGLFKSLRIAFKNATMYSLNHPVFIRGVEDLKSRAEETLRFVSPLTVGFTPRSLFADGRFWEGEKIYRELGSLFHLRKIKSLEIRSGLGLDELMRFSSKITLPLNEFVREGGAAEILKKEKIFHIAVEELDYGELLKGEGEEIKDIWPYLLQEAVEQNDEGKIEDVAASFERVIGKFDTENLLLDEELSGNFSKFFAYLKDHETTKYRSCAKSLIKSFVTNKSLNLQSRFDNLKPLISDLGEEDLASTIWEEIIFDDNFDSLGFSVFSKILESNRHRPISDSLNRLFQTENPLNRRPEVEEKIKRLLSGTSSRFISEIYRETLSSLLKDIRFDKKIGFDHGQLSVNYRYILLNLLARETERERMAVILERILAQWDEITGAEDFEYLGLFQDVLLAKRPVCREDPVYRKTVDALSEYVEKAILEGASSPHFDRLISGLMGSRFGLDVYLEKISSQGKLTPHILRAYYRFFKEDLHCLTSILKEKKNDGAFFGRIIAASKTIDSSLSGAVLKAVFHAAEEPIRKEALQAMGSLSEIDKNFLFSVLRSRKAALKGEALVILTRREATRKRALDRFLRFQSPYGLLNRRLRAHIRIVEDRELKEAEGHLNLLSRRKSAWNRSVRREARRVLERWHGH